jgi:hypothetical protein
MRQDRSAGAMSHQGGVRGYQPARIPWREVALIFLGMRCGTRLVQLCCVVGSMYFSVDHLEVMHVRR